MAVGNKFAESQGLSYVPNDAYLQESFKGSTPLDFSNISSSGIMSQAPIPRPLQYIREDGGDGGGGDTGPDLGAVTADDYGYGAVGNDPSMNMTDEEQEGVDNINNARMGIVDGLRAMGAFTFGGPIAVGHSLHKSQVRAKEKAIAAAKAAQQQRDREAEVKGIQQRLDSGMSLSDIGKESYTGAGMAFEARNTGTGRGPKKDGGRAGYFFGGRVNYKAGGRTDAGPNRSTASKAGVGQINEAGNKVDGGNYNDGGNNNNPPPTFYDNGIQVITDQSKLGFNYPTGLTKNLGIGQLTAILDARKSLEEEEPEGMVQYDSSIGPVDTRATFDTTTGPEFNASYTNNNFNANLNSKTGLGVNYSKDIGPGTFTAGGTYNPDGTYNAKAKYGISFGQGKKNGGRISFANGGLASIL
jgi:hypothetical protein